MSLCSSLLEIYQKKKKNTKNQRHHVPMFYTTNFPQKILPHSAGPLHACVSLSLTVNTMGDWVGEGRGVFTLYLMSKRSYSPVMPAGDLHVLEQLRASQVHFSAQEQPKHVYIHTELSISTGCQPTNRLLI